ncbi:MAG: FHA domain-containing protein [Gammaproteobacteria bacterium]|nr:FHA domain-containing protein [Gammaproteobacteria bacterium]
MAWLIHLDNGVASNKIPLDKDNVLIGRGIDNDITIDDMSVSSQHARIGREILDEERAIYAYFLEDLDSTNGTFLNDNEIKRTRLHNEDVIRVAFNEFTFIDENEPQDEKTRKIHKSWIPGIFYTK